MAFKDPNAPFLARKIVTGTAPNSYWSITSNPANAIQGYPRDANVNGAVPGELFVDSTLISSPPNRYMYEVRLHPPYSPLVPTADPFNPQLRLTAHENTGQTSGQLMGDIVQIGGAGNSPGFGQIQVNNTAATPDIWTTDPIRLSSQNGWTAPVFQNSWVDVAGARVGYYKNAVGEVNLRGSVQAGTAVTMFNLPAGFRPSQTMQFVMRSASAAGNYSVIQVQTNGDVVVSTNLANAQIACRLDLTFPTL